MKEEQVRGGVYGSVCGSVWSAWECVGV
jgi:hypothetical protein